MKDGAFMDDVTLAFTPATKLAELIRTKQISPVEVMAATLRRIEALNPRVNAFANLDADRAMGLAKQAEAALLGGGPIGRLHGLPTTIKDLAITKDLPTEFGSCMLKGNQPTEDTPFVTRLQDAGAIVIGKTTTSEFGWKGVSESPLTGITHNPWKYGLQRRRVVGRGGCGGGGGVRPSAPGQRRRRIDPHAVTFLRRVRAEAELRAGAGLSGFRPAITPLT